jgi:hypothetical protein
MLCNILVKILNSRNHAKGTNGIRGTYPPAKFNAGL